jgi:hypothetical protein
MCLHPTAGWPVSWQSFSAGKTGLPADGYWLLVTGFLKLRFSQHLSSNPINLKVSGVRVPAGWHTLHWFNGFDSFHWFGLSQPIQPIGPIKQIERVPEPRNPLVMNQSEC